MTPIEKYAAYLVGRVFIVNAYANKQLELLRLHPYKVDSPSFTGGVFGENNTGKVQVYVSNNVKYFL